MNAALNNFKDKYWDNYTGGLKTILGVVLYLLLYALFTQLWDVSLIPLVLLPIISVFNCYKTVKYSMGTENYLLVPTKNDTYYHMSSLFIGSVIILVVISLMVFKTELNYIALASCLITGLAILITGIYALPHGMIKMGHNKITIFKYEAQQDTVSLIEIKTDRILITYVNGKRERINNLNIDFAQGEVIREYILSRTNSDVLIVQNDVREN